MVNQLGHVSSPEFWPAATNSAAAIVVLVVLATKWTAEATEVELMTTRISWRSPLGSGWPESTAASSAAAAGVRSCTGTVLELEVEQSEALGMLYGVLRTRWARRGDQMVTGAVLTASSATAEVRPWWETGLRRGNEGEKRGKRWRSSPRLQWASKRARGRAGDGESTAMVVGARGGRRWRRRLHGASDVLWLDGEL